MSLANQTQFYLDFPLIFLLNKQNYWSLKPGLPNSQSPAFLLAIRFTTAWKIVVHVENQIQIENILKVWRYNIIAIIIEWKKNRNSYIFPKYMGIFEIG